MIQNWSHSHHLILLWDPPILVLFRIRIRSSDFILLHFHSNIESRTSHMPFISLFSTCIKRFVPVAMDLQLMT